MLNKIIKLLLPAIILTFFFCVGSVYASFNFDVSKPNEDNNHFNVDMEVFPYFFPTTEEGAKNEELINNLISGTDERAGLNNPNSDLNTIITSRVKDEYSESLGSKELLGSMDKWESDKLKDYLADNEDMTFIIYFPESERDANYVYNKYYIFTTCVPLVKGEIIGPVYRTTLQRNIDNNYEIVEVKAGSATCDDIYYNYYWYRDFYTLSFDIYQWEPLPE